jgi:UDP-N-acetylmuramyl tripeptide synthase
MRKQKLSRLFSQKVSQQEHRTSHASQQQNEKSQLSLKHQRNQLRAGLAIVAGRATGALSRRLHLGGGTSIIGLVAQSVYPEIIEHLAAQLEHGAVVVTGTNGKTTTSSFIAAILSDGGLRVWHNREGSNLMRGVASSLVIRALPTGRLRRSGHAISVLEIDEAILPQILQAVPPRVVIFTNLFRDQLDRYGEVDSIRARWQSAIKQLPASTTLVLNADDPTIAQLAEGFSGQVLYYGINDLTLDLVSQQDAAERHQVIDTRTCPRCGSDYHYHARFYSHMGHYDCPKCGLQRPQPDIRALRVQPDSFDQLRILVETTNRQQEVVIPLPGLYNIYNALAAMTATLALDIAWEAIISGIEQFKPVFGRGERIQVEGRTIRLLLAKNPTGFNEVLRTLFTDETPRHVLFILNDKTADGRDISWIWDVDFERVVGKTLTLAVSGTRAFDLALRLKYAGIPQQEIMVIPPAPLRALKHKMTRQAKEHSPETASRQPSLYGLKNALKQALNQTPVGETLFIVPTYTGLLEVHRELERRGLTAHYWEGRDA